MKKITIEDVLKEMESDLEKQDKIRNGFWEQSDYNRSAAAGSKFTLEKYIAKIKAASLNRQGCRWTKASERLPEDKSDDTTMIIFRNLQNVKLMPIYPSYTRNIKALLQNDLTGWEWLDESIEPCATSSEAVEILKELCQLKHYKDTVGKDSVYEKSQPEAWKKANNFLNSIMSTPSPTGDRDCEELKKEVERLKGLIEKWEKEAKEAWRKIEIYKDEAGRYKKA